MGIINECMLDSEKCRVPSEVGDIYDIPNDVNYYRKTYQNTPRYNDYLDQQYYRTLVVQPSEKNSLVYQKMINCSQPPSEVFNNPKLLQQQSHVNALRSHIKTRKSNRSHIQNANQPKVPRRSGQPLSYQPMKPNQKNDKQKQQNSIGSTYQSQV